MFSAPDAAPVNLRGNYTNSTAIKIEWDLVPEEDRNGVITRYIVSYKAKGASSRWQEIIVNYSISTLQIGSLEYYTLYEFKIAAETSINRGPFSNITDIRTDADCKIILLYLALNSIFKKGVFIDCFPIAKYMQWNVNIFTGNKQ